jgi:2'-5' RNA ligase
MRRSALIIEVPWAEPLVGPWRERYDPTSHRGIPAHITVLAPFRAPDQIDDTVIDRLDEIAAATSAPWAVSLVEVRAFPDAVWLRLDPIEPFEALSAAVWSAFPDCPPHGGRWIPPLPLHVTLAQDSDPARVEELRAEIDAEIAGRLPVSGPIEALSLFVSDDAGASTRRMTFPFAPDDDSASGV